jgi:hypothetical protein
MTVITKTFSFDVGPETMVNIPIPPSPLTFSWLNGDSQSGIGGCVHFTTTGAGSQEGRGQTVGNTWESWGVPPGATVLTVQVLQWYSKVAQNTDLQSVTLDGIRLVDANGNRVYIGSDSVDNYVLNTTIDASWQAQGPGIPVSILLNSRPSNTPVQFVLDMTVVTSAGVSNVDVRLDTITLAITYSSTSLPTQITLVQQAHNMLRYLIEYDGSTLIPFLTTTNAGSPDILTDAIAGPILKCAQAFTNGIGILPPGPLTQAQARAIWISDNPSLAYGTVLNGPRCTLRMQNRLNALTAWAVDVNVDGGGHPYVLITADAAGKAYLEIRMEDAPCWVD